MPKHPSELPSGVRPTDMLTVTQFAIVFPLDAIRAALEKFDCGTVRERCLTNESVVYFVMMLALFRSFSHREVFRCVAEALQLLNGKPVEDIVIPSHSGLSRARIRVKAVALKELFHTFAKPCANAGRQGARFKGWTKYALDGCMMNVEDTKANKEHFGAATNQHQTKSRNPQLRWVGLMEVGTHIFVSAEEGGYHDGEITLAKKLIPSMTSDMVILADRNFYSFEFYKQITQSAKAALVFRVQAGMVFERVKQLDDGSHIIKIYDAKDRRKEAPLEARFIQYKVTGAPSKETIFLITSILDPEAANAEEIAQLYHERWEYENALDEFKTHMGAGSIVMRSKTPELVLQEYWATMMTFLVIRKNMSEAAARMKLDSDRLSFTHTIQVVKRAVLKATGDFSP